MTTFNKTLAKKLARLSGHAFGSRVIIQMLIPDLGYDEVDYFEDTATSTEGFVCSNSDEIVVVFRGSQQATDWYGTNFRCAFLDTSYGKVHTGFWDAYMSVQNQIIGLLVKHRAPYKALYVTGHSLGAALATVASMDLVPDATYTFGSPRVLHRSAAATYKSLEIQTFRVAIAGDMVTRVPKPLMGYRHVGELVYFSRKGLRKCCTTKWGRFKDAVADIWDEFKDGTLLQWEDHKVSLYTLYISRMKDET